MEEYTFVCNVRLGGVADCVKQPLKTKNVTKILMFHGKGPFQFPFA